MVETLYSSIRVCPHGLAVKRMNVIEGLVAGGLETGESPGAPLVLAL